MAASPREMGPNGEKLQVALMERIYLKFKAMATTAIKVK